jgi:Cdc6-like AAA superfamily ATPase
MPTFAQASAGDRTDSAIPGREEELAFLTSFVDRSSAWPAALLLEGAPGIGKTTLWREALAEV